MMHKKSRFSDTKKPLIMLSLALVFACFNSMHAVTFFQETSIQQDEKYHEYKGIVIDNHTNDPIISATISLNDTNISTITNDDGKFLIKIPKKHANGKITVSYLGYTDTTILITSFNDKELKIKLETSITTLSEINIDPSNPEVIMKAVMKNRGLNYLNDHTVMTAFYRETIKKKKDLYFSIRSRNRHL